MLVMCAIVELGQSSKSAQRIDQDSFEHIVMCIRILADPLSHGVVGKEYRALCRQSFHKLVDVSDGWLVGGIVSWSCVALVDGTGS